MKLRIKNLGPIQSAELDISKDFILIVGPNNIGKSYAISVLYCILKSFSALRNRTQFYYYSQEIYNLEEEYSQWIESIQEKLSKSDSDIDITREFSEKFAKYAGKLVLPALQQSLEGTFSDISNLQNRKTKKELEIQLENDDFYLEIKIKDALLQIFNFKFKGQEFIARKAKYRRTPINYSNHTVVYFPTSKKSTADQAIYLLASKSLQRLSTAVCGQVQGLHYLPASRSGLYQSLSAFGQIVAELSKSRTGLTKKIELPGISEPLSDYFLKLSDIRPISEESSRSAIYIKCAEEIENDILHGKVEFEEKTRRLMFKPEGVDLELDLSATSSMVSEISPIVSYLRYVLPRSDHEPRRPRSSKDTSIQMLILEEPEAHLHPAVQVKLIEILSRLSMRVAAKIVLTSHSNYIFNKCSNLIMNKSLRMEKFEAVLFGAGEYGSVTQDLAVSDLGIDDENFVDTAQDLYEEKMEIIDRMNDV